MTPVVIGGKAAGTMGTNQNEAISRKDRPIKRKISRKVMTNQSIFIDSTVVSPPALDCVTWNENFAISDHRPIVTQFVIGEKV